MSLTEFPIWLLLSSIVLLTGLSGRCPPSPMAGLRPFSPQLGPFVRPLDASPRRARTGLNPGIFMNQRKGRRNFYTPIRSGGLSSNCRNLPMAASNSSMGIWALMAMRTAWGGRLSRSAKSSAERMRIPWSAAA